jgi:folate-binding protein YgfZ
MDKVELADISQEVTAIGVHGPELQKVLQRAGFSEALPEVLELKETEWQGRKISVGRAAQEHFDSGEIWMSPADAPALWNALVDAGARPVGADALEVFRIAAGIPRYGVDIRSQDLPQETAQTQALNFTKGCYIGQEIVERIRSRGNVHRTLTGIAVDGPPPAAGAQIQFNGKDVGEITSAVAVPTAEVKALAMGYLRREAANPGAKVQIGNTEGTVSELPFPIVFAKELTHAE